MKDPVRHVVDGPRKVIGSKGINHSMHRKDGEEGTFDAKSKKVGYESEKGYHDLADKPMKPEVAGKPRPYYPSLHLNVEQFPAIGERKVGDEVEIKVKAKITGSSQNDDRHTVDLELKEAALEE